MNDVVLGVVIFIFSLFVTSVIALCALAGVIALADRL
jgi:hypothetical protein